MSLALTGGKDLQTPREDVERVRALVAGACTVIRREDVTHLVRAGPSQASLRTCRRLARRPVQTRVVRTVTEWVASVVA